MEPQVAPGQAQVNLINECRDPVVLELADQRVERVVRGVERIEAVPLNGDADATRPRRSRSQRQERKGDEKKSLEGARGKSE